MSDPDETHLPEDLKPIHRLLRKVCEDPEGRKGLERTLMSLVARDYARLKRGEAAPEGGLKPA